MWPWHCCGMAEQAGDLYRALPAVGAPGVGVRTCLIRQVHGTALCGPVCFVVQLTANDSAELLRA